MRPQQFLAQTVALLGIGGSVLATPALAEDCPELVGRLSAPIYAVAVSGDYAYLASSQALIIADVSDPSAPQLVGEVRLSGWDGGRVAVSGDYAYVADDYSGFRVFDVSTPSAPVEVGSIDTPGEALDVAVSGGYAYVADNEAGLRVIDVTTPSAPMIVGSIDTLGSAQAVAVLGGYAYVAVGDYGMRVIDVSTPSAPMMVGAIDTPGEAQGVAVAGGYAYVADGSGGLRVIDVSRPWVQVEVGFVDTPGEAQGVAVAGGYAYVADWQSGLRVIDVSTPSAPVEVGSIDTPGWARAIAVSGGYAYVADGLEGLRVIDVSTQSAPVEVGFVDALRFASAVAVEAGYAYVVGGLGDLGGNGLSVIDARTPFSPAMVGYVSTGFPNDVEVSGGYAYVAEDTGLRVIDVSTPSTPVVVGSFGTPGYAWDVAVVEGYAYVAASEDGLRVIDVSTPSAPVEVGFVDTPGQAVGVGVSGGYAYLASGGLRVIDVSTPSAPVEVGFLHDAGGWDVAVSGGYAYVAISDYGVPPGLAVIDVSTPSAPVEVGFVETAGEALDVAVAGGYAYVADGLGGLRVIDVATPSAPVEIGVYDTAGSLTGIAGERVAVSEGYVFFAPGGAGLYIFTVCGEAPDARECFIPAAAVAAGAQGAFFQTDVEINNTGTEEAEVHFQWLPRGQDNSEPAESEPITLAPGQSVRYENVLAELFGLGPDSLGALKLVASTSSVVGMSRTYNVPGAKTAGTFGQGLPAIRATEMIAGTELRRIIFLSENDDSRANVGCVNGSSEPVTINIGLFNAEGEPLETRTMDLGPWSNDQINRVFEGYAPVNGYVDVWADSDEALYYCYGSMLDNETSDPTTILPQVPSDDVTFIPAAALAAGFEGAFFQTDVDLNNVGSTDLTYELLWLPRGADNSEPVSSETFSLAPGAGVRYANVLGSVFGLDPDQVGALAIEASGVDLLAMSRTCNLPSAKVAGTFGQELPGIPADRMMTTGERKRIIFMNENDDIRSNVGCQNGSDHAVRVFIELFNAEGESLETRTMDLAPYSNNQITRVFRNYAPVNAGYVDVWTTSPGATIYCYGSVLDNLTSDPTTVLPQ